MSLSGMLRKKRDEEFWSNLSLAAMAVTAAEWVEYGSADWSTSGVAFVMVNAYSTKPVPVVSIEGTTGDFASASMVLVVDHIMEDIGGVDYYSSIKVTPVGGTVPSSTSAKITCMALCSGKVLKP